MKNQIITNVIKLPKVPGAKGKYPAKKKVQISLVKSLFFKIFLFLVLLLSTSAIKRNTAFVCR